MSLPYSSPEEDGRAFSAAAAALAQDLPLLMFGSGDVQPEAQDAGAVALVAELTAQYMSLLVDAAVDAHDLLTDGGGGILPPPPVPNNRVPPRPSPPQPVRAPPTAPKPLRKKRKLANVEYWDDPLPEPKIRAQHSLQPVQQSPAQLTQNSRVHVDEWVGVAGVDLWETSRSRGVHVSAPSAIGTQCFIFPICHDAGLYGRVMEVQAARRNIEPVLLDPIWMELVRTEGGKLGNPAVIAGIANRDQDEDEDDEEDHDHLPVWPGLEALLPIHRG